MANNCSYNLNSSTEINHQPFAQIFENHFSKIISIIVTIILVIPLTLANFALIWYEKYGSDKKRTFMNKMFSSVCWSITEFYILVQLTEAFLFSHGPLPEYLCFIHLVNKKATITQVLLFYDVIALTRYIFIFWLKNPGAFKDDFWSLFINLWVVSFSFSLQFVSIYLPGHQPLSFYICTGIDPDKEDFSLPKKGHGLIELVSFVIHIVVYVRVRKFKVNTAEPWTSQINVVSNKMLVLKDIETTSVATFATNVFPVLFLGAGAIYIVKLNSVDLKMLTEYPNFQWIYLLTMVGPCLLGVFATSIYFARHQRMRRFLIMTIKDAFMPSPVIQPC